MSAKTWAVSAGWPGERVELFGIRNHARPTLGSSAQAENRSFRRPLNSQIPSAQSSSAVEMRAARPRSHSCLAPIVS